MLDECAAVRDVVLTVMGATQPANVERAAVIVVMGVSFECAANFAGVAYQLALAQSLMNNTAYRRDFACLCICAGPATQEHATASAKWTVAIYADPNGHTALLPCPC